MNEGNGNGRRSPVTGPAADQWTHRQALQLVAMLPDDLVQATAILDRAKYLLDCWTLRPEEPPTAAIQPFRPKVV